jgi:hypothetical protein
VNRVSEEGVCVPHDRSDIEVVLEILDGDVKAVTSCVQVGDNRFSCPVSILIQDIASIAGCEEFSVEPIVIWPGPGMRPNADLVPFTHQIRS